MDGNDRNIGPSELVDAGGMVAPVSESICSQLYVNEDVPFASVATPVNLKGVDFGIV